MSARGKIPEALRPLLRSELEKAIYEEALHRDDDLIARRYMIDKWAQADIAAELGWERSTISRHISYIFDEVGRAAARITQIERKEHSPPAGMPPSRGFFVRKYSHGGRGDIGLVHVAALPTILL